MASKDAHLKQAAHNEKLYSQLLNTQFLDWAVTAIFYSGLHYFDGYLAAKSVDPRLAHPPTHDVRTPLVARESNLRHIYSNYRRLKDESEAARYRVKHFIKANVEAIKEKEFETLKSHVSKYF